MLTVIARKGNWTYHKLATRITFTPNDASALMGKKAANPWRQRQMETTRHQRDSTDRSPPSNAVAKLRVVIRSRFREPDWAALVCWLASLKLDD